MMTKEQYTRDLKSIFHKVVEKESLDVEEQRLLDELLEKPEWREVYEKLSDGEYVVGRLEDLDRYPKREAFEKFQKKAYAPSLRKRFIQRVAVAASIVLVIGISGLMMMKERSEVVKPLAVATISAGTQKASLVLGSGEVIQISDTTGQVVVEGVALLSNGGGELVYHSTGESEWKEGEYNQLIVPRGGEYSIVLGDGTKVKMNAGTRLRYPVHFSPEVRKVEVWGEAFFEVAKNEKVPFVVTCGGVDMKVLGTSFNVNYYQEELFVTTTLVTGKLEVSTVDHKVVLLPGIQSRVDVKTLKIDTLEVDTDTYTAWVNNKFSFNDESLDLILASLSRWYDVEFVCENIVAKEYRLTGKIPRHSTLQEVVVLLEKISNLKFEIKDRKVIVR